MRNVFPRCKVYTTKDYQTYDLAGKLQVALESEMNGVAPKLIRSTLHRKFADLNREIEEATFNESIPLQVYTEYHGAISEAVASSPLPAILLDIHGYSDTTGNPPVTWVMLGK